MIPSINSLRKDFPLRFNFFNSSLNDFFMMFFGNFYHSGSKVKSPSLDYQRNANYWRNSPHVPDSEYYSHEN